MVWRYVVIDRTSVEKHLYVAMRLELCSLLTFSRESRFVALPTKTILNKRFQADKTITRARYRLSDRIFAGHLHNFGNCFQRMSEKKLFPLDAGFYGYNYGKLNVGWDFTTNSPGGVQRTPPHVHM